jgi:hypothetical protein
MEHNNDTPSAFFFLIFCTKTKASTARILGVIMGKWHVRSPRENRLHWRHYCISEAFWFSSWFPFDIFTAFALRTRIDKREKLSKHFGRRWFFCFYSFTHITSS